MAIDSLVSNGCVVTGSTVDHSVVSTNVSIGSNCEVVDSVILPNARIGPNCRLSRCVIDSDCSIPSGTVVGYDRVEDERRFDVTDGGIVLVTNAMLNANVIGLFQSHVA